MYFASLSADQWRVPLMAENPDYINANYVVVSHLMPFLDLARGCCLLVVRLAVYCLLFFAQGYDQQQAYVVAQSPLKDTRRDFWKMVFEREIPVIMMLCTTSEGGKVCCGACVGAQPSCNG